MNTDDLIRALAADGATAKGRWSAGSRIAAAALISLAAVVVLVVFTFGMRPDLPDALVTPAGIAKFVLSFVLAAAACIALARAVEPGRIVRLDVIGMALGLALEWALSGPSLRRPPRSEVSPSSVWSRSLALRSSRSWPSSGSCVKARRPVPRQQELWQGSWQAGSLLSALVCPAQWISGLTWRSGIRSPSLLLVRLEWWSADALWRGRRQRSDTKAPPPHGTVVYVLQLRV